MFRRLRGANSDPDCRRVKSTRWLSRSLFTLLVLAAALRLTAWHSDYRLQLPTEDSWLEAKLEYVLGEGWFSRRIDLEGEPGGWHQAPSFLALGSESVRIEAKGKLLAEYRVGSLPESLTLPAQLRVFKSAFGEYLTLSSLPEASDEYCQVVFRVYGEAGEKLSLLVLGADGSSRSGVTLQGDHADVRLDLRPGYYLAELSVIAGDDAEARRSFTSFELSGTTAVGPLGMKADHFERPKIIVNQSAVPVEQRASALASVPWPSQLSAANWPSALPAEGQDSAAADGDFVNLSYSLPPDCVIVAYPELNALWCGQVDFQDGLGRVLVTPELSGRLNLRFEASDLPANAEIILENRPFELSPALSKDAIWRRTLSLDLDDEGRIQVEALPAGPYTVVLKQGAKVLATTKFLLHSGSDLQLTFPMLP